jgi:hypothetical protein
MARTEIQAKFGATPRPENVEACVQAWRKQGLRDLASARAASRI